MNSYICVVLIIAINTRTISSWKYSIYNSRSN